jgi:hypothetical protein
MKIQFKASIQAWKVVGVILLVCGLQEGGAKAATITTFDAPGAGTGQFQGTQAFSINQALAIAGYYIDTGGTTHCFLRAPNGTFTLPNIDPPGSIGSTEFGPSGTAPIVINPTGAIAGNYYDANGGLHGFLRAP